MYVKCLSMYVTTQFISCVLVVFSKSRNKVIDDALIEGTVETLSQGMPEVSWNGSILAKFHLKLTRVLPLDDVNP